MNKNPITYDRSWPAWAILHGYSAGDIINIAITVHDNRRWKKFLYFILFRAPPVTTERLILRIIRKTDTHCTVSLIETNKGESE